jgi:hypothetical protein
MKINPIVKVSLGREFGMKENSLIERGIPYSLSHLLTGTKVLEIHYEKQFTQFHTKKETHKVGTHQYLFSKARQSREKCKAEEGHP